MTDQSPTGTFDLIVVGGGAAGLATAAHAAQHGARTLVLEKADHLGGSAALSAGILWTAPDRETLRRIQPDGDPVRGPLLVEGYERAVAEVRAAGAGVSEEWTDHLEWGRACKIDIAALFAAWSERIGDAGGLILTSVSDVRLLQEGRRVTGVGYVHQGRALETAAPSTILATGGFQGDTELRQTLIGNGADTVAVRGNPCSVGDGFRLGSGAGGAASRHLSAFYGHLLPSPLTVSPEHFLPLTQYHSAYGIIVNRRGRRFTDESLGDEVSNQMVARDVEQRAVLMWDEDTQQRRVMAVPYPNGMALDRFEKAREAGARTAKSDTVEGLIGQVAAWGVDRNALRRTLEDYIGAAAGKAVALDAPLPATPASFSKAPFYAVEVQPCITMPFGGLDTDSDGRVLDRDSRAVPGLFAVGADVGGIQDRRYVGGIVIGFVFGPRAADAALAEAGLKNGHGIEFQPAS